MLFVCLKFAHFEKYPYICTKQTEKGQNFCFPIAKLSILFEVRNNVKTSILKNLAIWIIQQLTLTETI